MVNLDKILTYEQGDMDDHAMINLFQELINDGSAYELQGHYGRMAEHLIAAGLCQRAGSK